MEQTNQMQTEQNGPRNRPARAAPRLVLPVLALLVGLVLGTWFGSSVLGAPIRIGGGAQGAPGSSASAASSTTPAPGAARQIDLDLLNEAQTLVDQHYVDIRSIQPITLTYGAISGMVDALGDTGHSRFLTPADVKAEESLNTGQYEGVGLEVETKDGNVVVVAPLDGSPAQKAGLRSGDIIMEVNGKSVKGLSLEEVVNQVLGPAGTSVSLSVLRPSTNETLNFNLTRAKVNLQSVAWQQLPGTTLAHLRISEFSEGVGKDVGQALREIEAQHLTGIVLDLRNNPGGLLNEGVVSASYFLTGGNVLLEKDSQGKITPVPVQPQSLHVDLPVVVLVNEGTASAAEIVAGALQDAHRAQLLGATTVGTGTVLNEFPLSDGSALFLAVQEWLTPSGRVIWHQGIQPDQAVALPPDVTPLVPEEEQGVSADQLQKRGDSQLLAAITKLSAASK